MNRGRGRLLARFLIPAILGGVLAVVQWMRPLEIKTSLYDLVGNAGRLIPEAVRTQSADLVPIVVSSTNAEHAVRAAETLFRQLPTNDCAEIRFRVDGAGLGDVLDFYRAACAGLVSESVRADLETRVGRERIAKSAARRFYSSPVPPLFPPEEDPFGLLDGFVTSRSATVSGWTPRGGVLQAQRDGWTHVLIVLRLKPELVGDADALIAFKGRLDAALAAVPGDDVRLAPCGVPIHTALTAARCKSEIGWLTVFSFAFICILAVFVFRSVRWIPLLALSLGVAALAGGVALVLCFRFVHLMTIVFGTTLLGLVIDYSFHWLLQGRGRKVAVLRSLAISFVTTEVSLIPLMIATLPVLRQSAVFLGVGLLGAFAFVLCAYPPPPAGSPEGETPSRFGGFVGLRILLLVLAACAGWGLFHVRFGTEPTALYNPAPRLAEAERLLAELSGAADSSRGTLVIEGSDSLDELLAREESLDLPVEVSHLSRLMPSLSRRKDAADLVARLYAECGARQKSLLGFSELLPPSEPQPWQWERLPTAFSPFFHGHSLVVPSVPRPSGDLPTGVSFWQPRQMIGDILSAWSEETCRRLGVALVLMLLILLCVFRLRAVVIMAPSAFAMAVVAGLLGLLGERVNLFHLLAGFLLAGMSIDYTVFLHSGRGSVRPTLCSLLTSLAGFGALAFVSFPIVRAFGLTLGVGLPVAFLAALALRPQGNRTEHGASPLGLEILWLFYRLLGLRVLHFLSGLVGVVVWTCSPAVRRTSGSVRKVVNFTVSLSDKLVVMAEGWHLPQVETDGSADARDFLSDIASRRGVFVLCSHCGTIEVLAALGSCEVTFHAWMEFTRTGVFNRFYLHHARRRKVVIHPISEFGPETVFEAGDALDAGDCLVMAGDRGFGRMRTVVLNDGRSMVLPEGVYRFAHALEHPIYFVACLACGRGRYRAIIRHLPTDVKSMAEAYAGQLAGLVAKWPDQWYRWKESES